MFANRQDAGLQLAAALESLKLFEPVVLALPRGGVVVAAEVAKILNATLDLVIARKIGHPANPEAAVGAVSEDAQIYIDERVRNLVEPDWLETEASKKVAEAKAQRLTYTGQSEPPSLEGKTVVLVDDGIATGSTMFAAIKSARARGAAKVVVAVPVGPPSTLEKLKKFADEVVAVAAPEFLYAVGAHYADFRQVSDKEVIDLLKAFRAPAPNP